MLHRPVETALLFRTSDDQRIWRIYAGALAQAALNQRIGLLLNSRNSELDAVMWVCTFVSLTCLQQNPIETLYRSQSGRILATPARLLGDLDVSEEALPLF